MKTGDLTGPFFARPFVDGKQIWKRLFAETFAQAKKEASHLTNGIPAEPQEFSAVQRDLPKIVNRVPLATAVETYLEQKSGKSQKTVYQCQRTLNEFKAVVGRKVRYLDEVTERILRTYKKSMEAEGYAGKTIDTRLNIVFFLLKKNGIAARIPRDEMPVIEEKVAIPYTDTELTKLFAAMDVEARCLVVRSRRGFSGLQPPFCSPHVMRHHQERSTRTAIRSNRHGRYRKWRLPKNSKVR